MPCRCALCMTANRTYQAAYAKAVTSGRLVLGAHVSATEVHQVIQRLLIDGFTKTSLSHRLGHRTRWLQYDDGVTLRTLLRLRRLQREHRAEELIN